MTTLYLKYGTYSALTLTWSASQTFTALKIEDYITAERELTKSLRGVNIVNHSFKRTEWDVVISADQLTDSTKLAFIKSFFQAHRWKFSLDDWTTEKEVVIEENERIPFELLEENKNLKEIRLKFIQKSPD